MGGTITYGNALGFGVMLSLFAGIILAVFTFIQMTVIDPEYISKLIAIVEEELASKGMADDQIEMALEMQKKFMTPAFISISAIFRLVFMGFIFSLITSIFLKKEKSPFEGSEVME